MRSGHERVHTIRIHLRDLLIIALSIYVLLALLIEAVLPISSGTKALLSTGDTAACVVFVIDFLVNLWKAKSKLRFLKWGWIDLVSSIPTLGFVRWGRAVRLFRLIRLLRAARAGREMVALMRRSRTKAAALTALFTAFLVVILSSIAILDVESSTGNIKGPSDALWWSISTITTVGYGDRYPVTSEGRIIAAVLMIIGVGLFGVLTGLFASWFVKPPTAAEQVTLQHLESQIALLQADVSAMTLTARTSSKGKLDA